MYVHVRRAGLFAVVLGIALLSARGPAAAQGGSPFLGEWELERFKSVFDPIAIAPERQIMNIDAAQEAGQITVRTRTWRNAVVNETSYTFAPDGRDYATTAAQATVAFRQVNPTTMERTAKLMNEVAETATWTISPDGRMLTIERKGTDSQGTPYSSTAYFMKVGS